VGQGGYRWAAMALVAIVAAMLSGCGSPVKWRKPEGVRCDHGAVVAKIPVHNDGGVDITAVITGTSAGGSVELGRQAVPAHSMSKVPMRQVARGRLGITVWYSGSDAGGQSVSGVVASFRGPNNDCA
jgi:hypothetical protein